MRVATIDERYAAFIDCPALDRWRGVRERLVSRSDFDPYSPDWRQLEADFQAGAYEDVLHAGERLARLGCLSPRFHFLLGVAMLETGDSFRAAHERRCTQICLEAILQTGDGTSEAPYLSTYCWDAYDVLRALGLRPQGQELMQRDGIWCDVLAADDQESYWFDVTDMLQRHVGQSDSWKVQNA